MSLTQERLLKQTQTGFRGKSANATVSNNKKERKEKGGEKRKNESERERKRTI